MNSDSWKAFDKICDDFFYPKERQHFFNPLQLEAQKEIVDWKAIDIRTTIDVMRYFINKMLVDPDFQEATMRILKFAKGRDVLHPLRVEFEQNDILTTFYKELYEWMMQNIQYVHDAIGSEYVRNPMRALYLASGDCDCMVTLYLSFYMKLCSMVGIKGTHFRIMLASDTKTPTHVFAMLLIGESWYGVDITNKKAAFGWFPDFKNYWVALDSTENLFPNPITHKFSKIKLRKISLPKPVK